MLEIKRIVSKRKYAGEFIIQVYKAFFLLFLSVVWLANTQSVVTDAEVMLDLFSYF